MSARDTRVAALRHGRERSRLLRVSVPGLILLSTLAWIPIGMGAEDLLSPRRQANLERFLGELRPYPLQGEAWNWGQAIDWAGGILKDRSLEAMLITLGISVAAIVLAALLGGLLALPAARNFATPEPYIQSGRRPAP